MTRRLYLSDPYTLAFSARVVGRRETPAGPAIVLDETYFYPESGGQPFDLGTIEGIPLLAVHEQGEEVLHVLERMPSADEVSCRIDAERRRDHMQQHDGQHILSAAFVREADAQTVSFHLGARSSTIDLDRVDLAPETIEAAERTANRVVRESRSIRSYPAASDEIDRLDLRKAPEVEGTLRIVEIEGFDRQACCGTHPRTTAEVGPIAIRSAERFKKGTRVEFVCGDRALRDYRTAVDRIRSLARILSSSEEGLVEAAAKLLDDRKALGRSLDEQREELLRQRALGWLSRAQKTGRLDVVVEEVSGVSPGELRTLASLLTTGSSRVALVGARADQRAHLVFARSEDVALDMAAILRKALPAVEGRGGGSAQIAQGGGPRTEGLSQALEAARAALPRAT